MKCEHCGSNLIMDAAYCPYCGNENPYFKQHRKEMAEYQEEYLGTKEEIIKETKSFKHITIKTTICSVLVALNLIVFVLMMNSWEITDWINSLYVTSNKTELLEEMEEYELEENFFEINYLYSEYNLYQYDEFDHYSALSSCISSYGFAYQTLTGWNDSLSYAETKEDMEYNITSLADSIGYLSERGIQSEYSDPEEFSELHVKSMAKMKQNILVLVQEYFVLDQETIDNFYTMTSYQREAALYEGVIFDVE